ncbi:MAG TPA: urease accessory protein UreD, partial [Actinomycetota bacterium]|nr:urease accessory protein UreD [Actinomycetota bacterium]
VVEGTRVVLLETRPPVAAKVLATPVGPELVLIGAAAGLLEGDTVTIDLRLGPGARLTVRTTAATLAHPCPDGGWTEMTVTAALAPGAVLAWLPEPLVACGGCCHRSRSTVDLGEGAAAVWSEACTLGRSGERAGAVRLRLDATLGGRPLLRDGLKYPDGAETPAVLAGYRHTGSVHLLGRRAKGPFLQLAGPGTTARGLAADAAGLERALGAARATFLSVIGPSLKEVPVHG